MQMASQSRRNALQCVMLLLLIVCRLEVSESQNVLAVFVFGDSLVDAGNNNYLFTLSKADTKPNGIDFTASGGQPNGRYTNGRTIPDIIGQELGLTTFAPPYLAPSTNGAVLMKGVNFASGGGGILTETGRVFIQRLSMDAQLDNYANTRQELINMLGMEEARAFLQEQSLFSVTIGSNDFINNYLEVTSVMERRLVSPEDFVEKLIQNFRIQLTRLYNMDARKIVVPNVGPIGCIPFQRATNQVKDGDCVSFPNEMALSYNSRLKDLIVELNSNFPGATFVYANVYNIVAGIIENYGDYGFEVADSACCGGGGRYRGIIPCGPTSSVCADHSKYVFWDPYHPSEASNLVIARRLLEGGSDDVFPINIRTLAKA